jgi:hypothetical protein
MLTGRTRRPEFLEQRAKRERNVEPLAQKTGLSIANASQHLQHMRPRFLRPLLRSSRGVWRILRLDNTRRLNI